MRSKLWVYLSKKVLYAAEQRRPDVQERRELWSKQMPGFDPHRLVFLDETWAKTNMTRLHGRAPRGERLVDYTPHGHWKTTTFLAALRCDGVCAPLVVDGAINGEIFLAYIKQVLAPTLRPGDIVIMDNLSSHKIAGVRETLTAAGATLLYLPPYSPDLNPIEQFFSKLKSQLRSAAERTVEGLWNRIGHLLNKISPLECSHYFAHSGYAA
jgi:transposase